MSFETSIQLVGGPLGALTRTQPSGVGAWLSFEGVVRPSEEGRKLAGLVYEAYEPMTGCELERLATKVATEHGLLAIHVEHSVGRVAAGEVSFRLTVGSRHRAEAIAATDAFIREMKRDVPLWKNPEFAV